jgi:hypothetical protein
VLSLAIVVGLAVYGFLVSLAGKAEPGEHLTKEGEVAEERLSLPPNHASEG